MTPHILDIVVEGESGIVATANLSGSAALASLADVRSVGIWLNRVVTVSTAGGCYYMTLYDCSVTVATTRW